MDRGLVLLQLAAPRRPVIAEVARKPLDIFVNGLPVQPQGAALRGLVLAEVALEPPDLVVDGLVVLVVEILENRGPILDVS